MKQGWVLFIGALLFPTLFAACGGEGSSSSASPEPESEQSFVTPSPLPTPTDIPSPTPTVLPTTSLPTPIIAPAEPVPTAIPNPTSTPIPSVTPSELPSGGVNSSSYFVFGHSLYTWDAQNEPGSTAESSVGYWLGALAQANGKQHGGVGQFGQLSYHAIPPFAQIGYTTNTFDPWPGGAFPGDNFSHMLIMPSNFEQTYLSPSEYMADTARVVDFIAENAPQAEVLIYEHWPEPPLSGVVVDGANLTSQEWQNYRAYTAGAYHDWFVEWQNLIATGYPQLTVRMIPVGPILADLFNSESYLASVSYSDLYADDAPHGSRTTYFLAALVLYRAMYLESPDSLYSPPSATIVSEVSDNLSAVIAYIDERLRYYQSRGVRVYAQ